MPSSRWSVTSSRRIWAWIVTSSAVVGSSASEELRLARQRDGQHHALALAARELVRVGAEPPLGVGNADVAEQLHRPGAPRSGAAGGGQDLRDLPLDAQHRIERGHRVLEHHDHAMAPDVLELPLGSRARSRPSKRTRPAVMRPGGWTSRTIARQVIVLPEPGLPDQREGLARLDVEADPANGVHGAAPGRNLDPQVLDGQEGSSPRGCARARSAEAPVGSLALDAEEVGDTVAEQDEGQAGVEAGEARHGRDPPAAG